jgi:branched-subunit amino acid aminotransferase/4-amino-4-deoxychorismate lyase
MLINGRSVTPDDLAPLALYNYGHFTSMRVEGRRVKGLHLHLARLASDSARLFDVSVDLDEVRRLIKLGAPSDSAPVMMRVTVFPADFQMGKPAKANELNILTTTRPASDSPHDRWAVRTVVFDRPLPTVKHVGLFTPLSERRHAQIDGYDDALFVDPGGLISEGPTWNIAFVKGSTVYWPEANCLPGVTMRLLQEQLPTVGVSSQTTPIRVSDLLGMDFAFASNATTAVQPIGRINDTPLGTDTMIRSRIEEAYAAIEADPL